MGEHEDVTAITNLCRDALAGKLKIDQFYSKWPKSAEGKSFLQEVYGDLEDGIQHTPGHLLKGGIDFDKWQQSEFYVKIYLDLSLLEMDRSFTFLKDLRERIIRLAPRSKSDVDRFLLSNPTAP